MARLRGLAAATSLTILATEPKSVRGTMSLPGQATEQRQQQQQRWGSTLSGGARSLLGQATAVSKGRKVNAKSVRRGRTVLCAWQRWATAARWIGLQAAGPGAGKSSLTVDDGADAVLAAPRQVAAHDGGRRQAHGARAGAHAVAQPRVLAQQQRHQRRRAAAQRVPCMGGLRGARNQASGSSSAAVPPPSKCPAWGLPGSMRVPSAASTTAALTAAACRATASTLA